MAVMAAVGMVMAMAGSVVMGMVVMSGCGARPQTVVANRGDHVRLYRDRALIEQRVVIVAASAGRTAVPLHVPADVGPAGIVVMDLGGLAGSQIRLAAAAPEAAAAIARPDDPLAADAAGGVDADADLDADADDGDDAAEAAEAEAGEDAAAAGDDERAGSAGGRLGAQRMPRTLELLVDAPRAGRFVVALGYVTALVRWEARYTISTGPAHDRGVLGGTVTIQNVGGIALHARARLVDDELGSWEERWSEQLRAALVGEPAAHVAVRALGTIAIATGETRIELLAETRARALRSVLVYDAIGPELDHTGAGPVSDPALGAQGQRTTRVTESVELERDRADRGLPGGIGTLIERGEDGARVVLGTARLFDGGAQVARAETVGIGTARGLVGRRERRDWGRDNDQRRFSEEFLVTIENARGRPVEVVIREHLYRGQNWTLAYQSAPAKKEGAQQIALRAVVPAKGIAKVLYVVVYTW